MIIIPNMARRSVAVCALAPLVLLVACGRPADTALPRGKCPAKPVRITVSVDQWTDLARTLAGDCAKVETVVKSTSIDPHEYEPTPADTAQLTNADLALVNGLGYDAWASKAVAAASPRPNLVNAATAAGFSSGDNPHVWYDPAALPKVATATTATLTKMLPKAATYLQEQSAVWAKQQVPYRSAVDRVAMVAKGRPYAATDPVAAHLARAVGLKDLTPAGFAQAAANDSEPTPGDYAQLLDEVTMKKIDVLVVNGQHRGNLTGRVVAAAKAAHVPVVTVTETVPPGTKGFVEWQVQQLNRLFTALKGSSS